VIFSNAGASSASSRRFLATPLAVKISFNALAVHGANGLRDDAHADTTFKAAYRYSKVSFDYARQPNLKWADRPFST
jgi:hypothetical protein